MATLRPKRGKRSTAIDQKIKLTRGEIFFEVPDNGIGTGVGNIVMGDGVTEYEDLPYFIKGSGGGGSGTGTVNSVNYNYPDAAGNIKLDSVPLAENLVSSDNLVINDTYLFRTSGNHTDIQSGYATLNIIKGRCYLDIEDNKITVATPLRFKSVGLNQFDKNSMFLEDYTINSQGDIIPLIGSYVCYVKAIGGLSTGYVAYSKSGTINRIGWSVYVPTASSSITVTADGDNVTAVSLGAITSTICATHDGYICIATNDKDSLCVHPRWSGTADMQFADYSVGIVNIPIADKDGGALPTAEYGFPSVNSVADEIDFAKLKYTQRIGHLTYTPAHLSEVEAMGVDYIYDSADIFYVLKTPLVYTLAGDISPIYTVNDYGTEEFELSVLPITAQNIYGQNLKDKLRRDVVTISNQALAENEQKQVRANINAYGNIATFTEAPDYPEAMLLDDIDYGNTVNTVFGSIKRLLRKLTKSVSAKVSSVNSVVPDSNGNVEITRIPLADNLYSSENAELYDDYTIRTTGGDSDVQSGEAQLSFVRGNVEIEGRTDEFLSIQAESTHVPGPGEIYIKISATIDDEIWRTSRYGQDSGVYIFTFDGSNWIYSSLSVNITSLGISVEGDVYANDTITVDYVKREQGTIHIATPTHFVSTGMNIFNKNDALNIIENATIDLSGKIKAEADSYVTIMHVPYANERGYVAYSSEYAITRIGFSGVKPTMGDTVSLEGAALGAQLSVYMVPAEGYLCVSTTDLNSLCVHPRWSGAHDMEYASYSSTTVTLPTYDRDNNELPTASYGMPSIDGVRDELNFDIKEYIKRIEVLEYSDSNLESVKALGVKYDYDSTYILYVLPNPKVYYLNSSISGRFTADDYGIETIFGTEVTTYTDNLYGSNLKAKLQNNVLTITEQTLTASQQAQVRRNIKAAAASVAVTVEEQSFTTEEKAQARTNIGAAASNAVVSVTSQTLDDAQKAQARTNIGAAPAITYGNTDLVTGTSDLAEGVLYFFNDGTDKKVYIGDSSNKAKQIF